MFTLLQDQHDASTLYKAQPLISTGVLPSCSLEQPFHPEIQPLVVEEVLSPMTQIAHIRSLKFKSLLMVA